MKQELERIRSQALVVRDTMNVHYAAILCQVCGIAPEVAAYWLTGSRRGLS